jgi:hypothetical protein
MTATTARFASSTATTITRYVLVAEPVKGETYLVTVATKTGEETFTGRYRGAASTGLRFVNEDGKVVTRSTSKIVKIEAEETHEVPAVTVVPDAQLAHFDAIEQADDAQQADEPPAEYAAPATGETTVFAELAPADTAESSETAEDVYDADPMVGGKRLSEMRFSEVMKLAQHYKTPGRGVARIAALRAGVAKAIAQEAGRLVGASA